MAFRFVLAVVSLAAGLSQSYLKVDGISIGEEHFVEVTDMSQSYLKVDGISIRYENPTQCYPRSQSYLELDGSPTQEFQLLSFSKIGRNPT